MERVWKHFGKNTEAGKLLYDLYGVGFKPEDHIKYPKLTMKKKTEIIPDKPKTYRNKTSDKLSKIQYPELNKQIINVVHKIDIIPKRKPQEEIIKELNKIKIENKPPVENYKNRKQQIENLQEKFQYGEKMYLPEKARPPKINIEETLNHINQLNEANINTPNKKPDELSDIHNKIINEIDERYKYLNELKLAGDKKQQIVIMNEIKSKIKELRTVERLRDEQMKNN